jgi:hypothetical protein
MPLHWFIMLAGALYFLSDYDTNAQSIGERTGPRGVFF